MDSNSLKKKIYSFIGKADDRVLSIVNSVFENYYSNDIVAFHPDGQPMTRSAYKEALDEAEKQILNEDFVDVDEMK
ncbi:MAG: hypothetical protein M9887_03580 [Chitinophagales bacterium]|nr:hypothetical protein [Chitinophagales bacterium]